MRFCWKLARCLVSLRIGFITQDAELAAISWGSLYREEAPVYFELDFCRQPYFLEAAPVVAYGIVTKLFEEVIYEIIFQVFY